MGGNSRLEAAGTGIHKHRVNGHWTVPVLVFQYVYIQIISGAVDSAGAQSTVYFSTSSALHFL